MPAIALFTIFFAIDWLPVRDDTRMGQMRFLLLVGFCASFKWLKTVLGPWLAALFAFEGCLWVLRGYSPHGLIHILCISLGVVAARWLADYKEAPKWIAWFGAAQAAFGLAQFFGWDPYGFAEPWFLYKPTGMMGQETLLGAFLAATLAPALFCKRWLSAATIFACILATKSTMSAAAAGAVIFLWIWSVSPLAALGLCLSGAGAGLAAYLYDPFHPFFSATRRGELWALAWKEHLERPIFGWGVGSWQPKEIMWLGLRVDQVHNEYLEALVEYGWTGMALILGALVRFFRRFHLTWHHAMVAGVLVNAIGNFPLHLAATGTLFLIGWILSERQGRIERCGI